MDLYSPKKSQIITAAILGAVGILGFLIFSVLTYLNIGKVEESARKDLEISKNIDNVLFLKKQVVEYKTELEALDSFFLRPGEEAYFIDRIESLAKSNSLKVKTGAVSVDEKTDPNFEIMNVTVNFEGKLSSITEFLTVLEKEPKSIGIEGVDINISSSADKAVWGGMAAVSVYKLKAK